MADTRLRERWLAPPDDPVLSNGEVHVWKISLTDANARERLEPVLTDHEAARARSFVFERDRERFIVAHGSLRLILGGYLRLPARDPTITTGHAGKPRLQDRALHERLRFNLSHSHDLAVCVVAAGRDVGVDVELIRPEAAADEVARRVFTTRELTGWYGLPKHLRAEAFFLGWTRKEAYVKARGDGLGAPLDSFEVSLTPGLPCTLSSPDHDRWTMHSFQPADGYAGALVVEGGDVTLRFWELSRAP